MNANTTGPLLASQLTPLILGATALFPGHRRPIALLAALALGACVAGTEGERDAGQDHPLAGVIYRTADRVRVDQATLVSALAQADFVLVGERHDNDDHHRRQTQLIRALQHLSARPRPVAFEMMTTDQQLDIVEHRQTHPDDLDGLADVLDWRNSGWPSWSMYAPLIQAALDADAEIVAANVPRAQLERVLARGRAALDPAFVQRTGLARGLPQALTDRLEQDLRTAHCGRAPADTIGGMIEAQRARDAMMADRLAAVAGMAGGILIAGNEHVRTDRGVPWYLRQIRPAAVILTVGLIEVSDDLTGPPADLPFDYVWFTPRVDGGDSCETWQDGLEELSDRSG